MGTCCSRIVAGYDCFVAHEYGDGTVGGTGVASFEREVSRAFASSRPPFGSSASSSMPF